MNKAQTGRTARYYLTYLLWYTALFAAVYFSIFVGFTAARRSYVWMDDGLSLYLPKVYYFIRETREFLASLLTGSPQFIQYDFAIGLGKAVPFHLEPVYWLYLLTDPAHVEASYSVLMFLRFYLAGLSVSLFLFYFKQGRFGALLASFACLCCGYGLWAGFRHSQFIIPMIMLPLCLLSVEEILRKKRWYLCTILIWIHLWCGYYFTYMDTVAMGVYFLIRFFCGENRRTAKEFFRCAFTIAGSYLLGVMIGNITLISSFASYLTSSRTEAVNAGTDANYLTYGVEWLYQFFHTFLLSDSPGYWMRTGFLPLALAAVVVLMLRRGKRSLKAAFAVGTLFCMIPGVAFALNGFSSVSNRWCYMYAFVLAVILGFGAEELLALAKRERRIIAAVFVPFLFCFVYEFAGGDFADRQIEAIGAVSVLLTIFALYYVNEKTLLRRRKAAVVIAVLVISVWGLQYELFSPFAISYLSQFPRAGEALNQIEDTPLAAADELEDPDFYRLATKRTNTQIQGASQVLDYYGTVHYDNTTSRDIQDFYRMLGLTSWSLVRMKGFNGQAIPNALAAVKYYILEKGNPADVPGGCRKIKDVRRDGKEYEIYENEAALPLGYTYGQVISTEDFLNFDTLQRQEILMQAAVLDEAEKGGVQQAKKEELISSAFPVEITDITCSENVVMKQHKLRVKDRKAPNITFHFDAPAQTEVYLYFKNLRWDSAGSQTITYTCGDYSSTYLMHGDRETYSTRQTDYILSLGYHSEGATSCTLEFEKKINLEFDSVQICCQPLENMDTYAAALRQESLSDVQLLPNRVRGNIALSGDKLLVLSIPYDSGWTACVDGEKAELLHANIMYMGLPLTAGEHTVELVYRMPGLSVSLLVSAAGLLIFIAALAVRALRRRGRQER